MVSMSYGFQQKNAFVSKIFFAAFAHFLAIFAGTLFAILTKINLLYVEFFSNTFDNKY